MELSIIIKKLTTYASKKLFLSENDLIYVQNQLLDAFNVSSLNDIDIDEKEIDDMIVPDNLITDVRHYLKEHTDYDNSQIELFIVKVMGIITPYPSAVINRFLDLEKENPQKALDYLYNLEIANNYIQKTAVDKNLYWKAEFEDNFLEITINLSKPEKKNSDIAKLVGKQDISYPKCLLCKENLGYAGRHNHPARENIRTIPMVLNDEKWFLQYSPYVYYYEHCIAISSVHEPMQMGRRIFNNLLAFVDRFPCFFIGSNSELPIVGGSILNHEHFQGGKHLMPMMYAKALFSVPVSLYPNCQVDYLNWYNSVIRITSSSREELLNCAESIYNSWCQYENKQADIIPFEGNVKHSTVTPVARKEKDKYIFYMILRNNLVNDIHPDGIFHAHKEYHNIKSEGIGLIEAMGMFILPARLERQTNELAVLLEDCSIDFDLYIKNHSDLAIHRDFILELRHQLKDNVSHEAAIEMIRKKINIVCKNILENVAVFKNNDEGRIHLNDFIKKLHI